MNRYRFKLGTSVFHKFQAERDIDAMIEVFTIMKNRGLKKSDYIILVREGSYSGYWPIKLQDPENPDEHEKRRMEKYPDGIPGRFRPTEKIIIWTK